MKRKIIDHILDTSGKIFLHRGFVTGIDRIIAECKIAKMTLYAYFRSKNDLIIALLRRAEVQFNNRVQDLDQPLDDHDQLTATFNLVACSMGDKDLRLGLAPRALLEFPDPAHPVHQAAVRLSNGLLELLRRPWAGKYLSTELLAVAQGAYLLAPVVGVKASRQLALSMGARMIAHHRFAQEQKAGAK